MEYRDMTDAELSAQSAILQYDIRTVKSDRSLPAIERKLLAGESMARLEKVKAEMALRQEKYRNFVEG